MLNAGTGCCLLVVGADAGAGFYVLVAGAGANAGDGTSVLDAGVGCSVIDLDAGADVCLLLFLPFLSFTLSSLGCLARYLRYHATLYFIF